MSIHWFLLAFIIFYFTHEIWETYLVYLNCSSILKNRYRIPEYFKDKIDQESYQKGIDYNLQKSRFGLLMQWVGVVLTLTVIFGEGFFYFDQWLSSFVNANSLHYSVVYCLSIALLLMVLNIPVSLYSHFVIEEKYGFNKMTAKVFIFDFLKGLILSLILGTPLLYLLFWLYQASGGYWWLWAFFSFFGFELFIAAVYPTWIAPLFNKFIPLSDGSLKEAIFEIARRINFKMSGIFTIDGSKRSTHSNAYFAGLGKMRRIVLFDTLVSQFTEPEIISVLAHEMGHNKKRHIQKQLLLSFFSGLFGFWILSLVMNWEPFYQAFNAGAPAPHKALILLALFSGHFTFMFTPLMNYLSRKYEYEADRFSVEVTKDEDSMTSSLVKLSKENLSNLTPDPLYSFYHYSHPTTLERIEALQNLFITESGDTLRIK